MSADLNQKIVAPESDVKPDKDSEHAVSPSEETDDKEETVTPEDKETELPEGEESEVPKNKEDERLKSTTEDEETLSIGFEDLLKIGKTESEGSPVDDIFSSAADSEYNEEKPTEVTQEKRKSKESLISLEPPLRFESLVIPQTFEVDVESRSVLTLGFDKSPSSSRRSSSYHGSDYQITSEEFVPTIEEAPVDRKMYYQLYELYTKKYFEEKFKNNHLQTKMADYYKRKRMYHVFYTDKQTLPDYQKRYEKLLTELEQVHEKQIRQEAEANDEIATLRNKCEAQKEKIEQLFDKLQKQERDFVTKEMCANVDGRERAKIENTLDRYLKRQKIERDNLKEMRLLYITLRNKYNEVQEKINSLDNLGSNYHLADYEQMKNDNRNLQDKLEEKELTLTNIRGKCESTMQILAHNREKVTAIEADINTLTEGLESVTDDYMDARENLTSMKQDRDSYRRLIIETKENAGLLAKPKMLKDFEMSMLEIEECNAILKQYKADYGATAKVLNLLRKRPSELIYDQPSLHFIKDRKSKMEL